MKKLLNKLIEWYNARQWARDAADAIERRKRLNGRTAGQ